MDKEVFSFKTLVALDHHAVVELHNTRINIQPRRTHVVLEDAELCGGESGVFILFGMVLLRAQYGALFDSHGKIYLLRLVAENAARNSSMRNDPDRQSIFIEI